MSKTIYARKRHQHAGTCFATFVARHCVQCIQVKRVPRSHLRLHRNGKGCGLGQCAGYGAEPIVHQQNCDDHNVLNKSHIELLTTTARKIVVSLHVLSVFAHMPIDQTEVMVELVAQVSHPRLPTAPRITRPRTATMHMEGCSLRALLICHLMYS